MDPLSPQHLARLAEEQGLYPTPEQVDALAHRLDEADALLTAIQASLAEVPAYEGMGIGRASLLLYINDLVRDQGELERRIDLALLHLRAGSADPDLLMRILKGHTPTPDTIEG